MTSERPSWGPLLALVALVLATRVLGLSLVLPGFRDHGESLGGSLALVGVAFGAYAVSQAALQIPLGLLSDRIGRRPVLLAGLAVSAVGSVLAAWAPTLPLLLLARLVQGAGAVNGVALALLGERVPDDRRATAMGLAGAAIGVAFTLGVVLGAFLAPVASVPALFHANAGLVGLALLAAWLWTPRETPRGASAGWRAVARATAAPAILALDAAAFATNLALAAVLFAFPAAAARLGSGAAAEYALGAVVLAGGAAMLLLSRSADRGRFTPVARGAVLALAVGAAGVMLAPGFAWLVAAGALFFAGQSVLAALVPAAASRAAAAEARGGAQSSVSVAGYLGVALGGALAGALAPAPLALAAILALAAAPAFFALARIRSAS